MHTDLPFPLHVAYRYFKSTRRDAFIRFLSLVTAAGICLGVAALILALAALSGFQDALKGEILARTPEIEVELPPTVEAASVAERLRGLAEIESVQLLVRGRGWLVAGGRARPAELVGYADELPTIFPAVGGREPGLYLGDRIATAWGLQPGDMLEVVSTRPTLTPWGPQPRVRRLSLAGTFATGRTQQKERLALPLDDAVALLGEGDRRLLLSVGDLGRALVVAASLADKLPEGSQIRTWSDLNRALLFALRLEKGLMFVAVFLIVVAAVLAYRDLLADEHPRISKPANRELLEVWSQVDQYHLFQAGCLWADKEPGLPVNTGAEYGRLTMLKASVRMGDLAVVMGEKETPNVWTIVGREELRAYAEREQKGRRNPGEDS